MGETYEGSMYNEPDNVLRIRHPNNSALYVDASQFEEIRSTGIDKGIHSRILTREYFKCKGTEENECRNWGDKVMIGKIYEGMQSSSSFSDDVLIIRMDNDETALFVDSDQFEEIEVIINEHTGEIINAEIKPKGATTRRDKRIKILTDKLLNPKLGIEEMNKLLDELNKLNHDA
jgi:hypothetical protein